MCVEWCDVRSYEGLEELTTDMSKSDDTRIGCECKNKVTENRGMS